MVRNRNDSGFSLVEISVALGIISAGIIGTVSLLSANRALMEAAWAQGRMGIVADSVMAEFSVRYRHGERIRTAANYNLVTDSQNYGFATIFSDNGFDASLSNLRIRRRGSTRGLQITLKVRSPSGRSLTRKLTLYEPFQ